MSVELRAAYERIKELEGALLAIRAGMLAGDDEADAFDPFDVIERSVATIDRVLDDKVVGSE